MKYWKEIRESGRSVTGQELVNQFPGIYTEDCAEYVIQFNGFGNTVWCCKRLQVHKVELELIFHWYKKEWRLFGCEED